MKGKERKGRREEGKKEEEKPDKPGQPWAAPSRSWATPRSGALQPGPGGERRRNGQWVMVLGGSERWCCWWLIG